MHGTAILLLANLAIGCYNAGTIWAHEIDTFRTWRLVSAGDFHRVQQTHWKKLPYWVFAPVALGLAGAVGLVRYHPIGSPAWVVWSPLALQAASMLLTAIFWGPWQAKLSADPSGPTSPYLAKILRTHWVRTALINLNAAVLLVWAILVFTG